jgi:biotin operon repressor
MDSSDVIADELAECLAILKGADRPMTAAQIAARLGLSGCRETQRRRVRAMTLALRDKGVRITANLQTGYFLAEEDDVWRAYLRSRQIEAKTILGVTHPRIRQAVESKGQRLLFGQRFTTGAYTGCGPITR